jgi:cold shock protein
MVGHALTFRLDTPADQVLQRPFLTGSLHATMRISGTVKFFNGAKGFGFISPEDGSKDVFVHATALEAAGIRSLNAGDKVTSTLEDDRKGRGK